MNTETKGYSLCVAISLIWDSCIILNFPMVVQSPYSVNNIIMPLHAAKYSSISELIDPTSRFVCSAPSQLGVFPPH